jgi:CspA family cold shock protein
VLGKVKFYASGKGYGFLAADDGSEHFFHISAVAGDWEPMANDRAQFEIAKDERSGKMRAVDVRILESA